MCLACLFLHPLDSRQDDRRTRVHGAEEALLALRLKIIVDNHSMPAEAIMLPISPGAGQR